ncbi:glycoside hydrolase family 78 protein [Dermatobacter hominis]|uniref:family 78 glycoside hydrolase catalytic domain n=1 Tax=Dermatobacter hominis TaxID=2884263 RepID=UPI001D12ABDC|nr:family 78 glycoside hydrolase catalytic domain [Dermatobacter hominis]UDY34908.1 glycoside hydrolase family 78 protein [Dermatobacter hominis]
MPSPRLSWTLPAPAREQLAFQVRSGDVTTERIESPTHVLATNPLPAAASRQIVPWQVKVWTDLGESEWSDPAIYEVGLLDPGDWTAAAWVAPADDGGEPGDRPAHVFRAAFELDAGSDVARARAYVTAHGIYELFINGERVGDLELTPGSTQYRSIIDVQTFDIASHLHRGTNVVGAVVSDGWYRGRNGFSRMANCYGEHLALLAQLEVVLADGRDLRFGTGPDWTTATGEIVAADLMDGERVDLRLADLAWCTASGMAVTGRRWTPVVVRGFGFDELTTSPSPPVRRIEEIEPVSVTRLASDRQVVDMGQNINGWVRLRDLGPSGQRTVLTHGERVGEDGDVDMAHLTAFDFMTREPLDTGQVDEVVSAGRPGDTFEPRHTTHGFQFVRIDGHRGPLTSGDIAGVVVHTDLRRTGWFRCSDERLNRLHEAALWSFRDNACDVPTDCPQRERAPWTGDWQVFAPTAAFLYDVAGFTAKWLRDLDASQWPDGRVSNFAPEPMSPEGFTNPTARFMNGSAGWGDAAVIVPHLMWQAYDDRRVLADQYRSMVRWVDWAAGRAAGGRHRSRSEARPEPAPHEQYLWDTGFHWGEWCEPGGNDPKLFTMELDVGDVATAYLHRSATLLAEIAAELGNDADADRYGVLAERTLEAWRAEFIAADGTLRPDTQANHVRALAFGLVPDELRARTAARLVELIRRAGTHLGTGFLSTPQLLPVLVDAGYPDVAFELLLQDSIPSWLAMIDRGATTIWENWEGLDASGLGSLNHYSKGAVVSFLHRYVAGIRPIEGARAYRRFRIEPIVGGGLTSAEAELDSPRGRIRSAWELDDGVMRLEVTVPPGSQATVVLPDGTLSTQPPGAVEHRCRV